MKIVTVKKFMEGYNRHLDQCEKDFAEDTLQVSWHTPFTPSRYAICYGLDIKGRRRGERIKAVIRRAGIYV